MPRGEKMIRILQILIAIRASSDDSIAKVSIGLRRREKAALPSRIIPDYTSQDPPGRRLSRGRRS